MLAVCAVLAACSAFGVELPAVVTVGICVLAAALAVMVGRWRRRKRHLASARGALLQREGPDELE